jgi:hypothetical protein
MISSPLDTGNALEEEILIWVGTARKQARYRSRIVVTYTEVNQSGLRTGDTKRAPRVYASHM